MFYRLSRFPASRSSEGNKREIVNQYDEGWWLVNFPVVPKLQSFIVRHLAKHNFAFATWTADHRVVIFFINFRPKLINHFLFVSRHFRSSRSCFAFFVHSSSDEHNSNDVDNLAQERKRARHELDFWLIHSRAIDIANTSNLILRLPQHLNSSFNWFLCLFYW